MPMYNDLFNPFKTKQTEQLDSSQVKNDAGGYVFKASDLTVLDRFLLIGTEDGSFYVSKEKLTADMAKSIIKMIGANGKEVVEKTLNSLKNNLAPKVDPALFVLALASTFGDAETKGLVYNSIKDFCRTSTHLFTFIEYATTLRGWSRGLRTGVAKWYLTKDVDKLSYQVTKYRQRNGWTHKDVLRLSHPNPTDSLVSSSKSLGELFKYITTGDRTQLTLPSDYIVGYELAKTATTSSLVEMIDSYGLTWEMIPTEKLNDKDVLVALMNRMPLGALLRNLNRLTQNGVFESNLDNNTKKVVSDLTNPDLIKLSRLHPINILNTLKTYSSGRGFKGHSNWMPHQPIVDALETMLDLSYDAVEPSNKRLLVALDVSGSMTNRQISNFNLTPAEVGTMLLLTLLKTESNVEPLLFTDKYIKCNVGKRDSFETALKKTHISGGTDCSIPFKHLLKTDLNVDAVILLSDYQTWAGDQHPAEAFYEYRRRVNSNTKGIGIGMVANEFSLFPNTDFNSLNICGFDLSVIDLMKKFI